MADAHRRRFDVIAVWKFDRFARSVSHLLRALENFQALGIQFVSLTEGIDTSTPAGKMVFTVLGAVAELERSLIAERVRAGLRNAKAKGKALGRPKVIADAARIGQLRGGLLPCCLSLIGNQPSVTLNDSRGFMTQVGSTDLVTTRTGVAHKTSAASVVLFGNDGKMLWSAPR
jgi:hypothetical protein